MDKQIELSMNSVVGFTSSKIMKLRGKINGETIVILIDCAITHNFIAQDLF